MCSMTLLMERKEEYQPLPEKALARLWQKRAARQRDFRTDGGRRVRVLYPGRPGAAAGPDFRHALLEVEGLGLVQGDVELHLRQRDWYSHGHDGDPNYDGVVLHAALETDARTNSTAGARPTNLHSGHRAPVISLAALVQDADTADLPSAGDEAEDPAGANLWALLEERGWPHPADAAGMGQLLDAAGDSRFLARAALSAALNQEQPASQTLYEGLMEALGYRANRQPFLKLAQRAPWPTLAVEAMAHFPEHRPAVLEARLLQFSGLEAPARTTSRRPPGYGVPLQADEWHTFRVRPANHPRRRIAGAARLLARFLEASRSGEPAEQLVTALNAVVAQGSPASLTAALTVTADRGPACVGADRARDLAVNVALPFCHSLAKRSPEKEDTESTALALYKKFPRLQENEITREMAGRLLRPEWGKVVTTGRRQQGLIHLHKQLA